jgi:hypothetical protein
MRWDCVTSGERLRRSCCGVLIQVRDDDRGPFGDEAGGDGEADTLRGTGHDRDLASEQLRHQ